MTGQARRALSGRMAAGFRAAGIGLLAMVWMALAAGALHAAEPWPVRTGCADTALVLAIDGSASIDALDFALQMQGYASAFRDREVHHALQMAGVVDVAVVVWGDGDMSAQILPFRRIRDRADAELMAREIAAMGREVTGNTGLARGIEVSLGLLADPSVCATRKIVDVSGDGRQKHEILRYPVASLRSLQERAEAMGVTINALAIETDDPGLAEYFEERVTAGPTAFVIPIRSMRDFGGAIVEKLRRELLATADGEMRSALRM